MRALQRGRYTLALVLSTIVASCDTTEVKKIEAPTQIMARLDSKSDELRMTLTALRITLGRQEGDDWVTGEPTIVPREALHWPVDLPITPRSKVDEFKQFDIVIEALKSEEILAQTRAVTTFVPMSKRVLPMWIELCPDHERGFVCSEASCRGHECEVCARDGSCEPVAMTDPNDLETLDELEPGGRGDAGFGQVDARVRDGGGSDARTGDGAALGGEACDEEKEGQLRCAAQGSVLRERCQSGRWTTAEPCADGQICDADAARSGDCHELSAICQGRAGQHTCDGATMVACSESGEPKVIDGCGTPAACQAGLAQRACPPCTPNAFRCTEALLEQCATDGQAWKTFDTCDTAALCNDKLGACTASACLMESKECNGDMLRKCKSDLSGFEDETQCDPGLCDEAGKECDACVPNSASCQDSSTVSTCDAEGHGFASGACDPATPVCVGAGRCVECGVATDCRDPGECYDATCDLLTGVCGKKAKASGATCTGGVCDGSGNCGDCRSGEQRACGTDEGLCVLGTETCVNGRWSGVCAGSTMAATEKCDGQDNDCDGQNDEGTLCTDPVLNRCIAGRCAQCGTGVSCPSGQACNNITGKCEPTCGNGAKESAEPCDPSAGGYTTFTCSNECTSRELFALCAYDTPLTRGTCPDPDEICGSYGGSPNFCLPRRNNAAECPAITEFTWVIAGLGVECVIPCSPNGEGRPSNPTQCPSFMPNCFTNPLGSVPAGWCTR